MAGLTSIQSAVGRPHDLGHKKNLDRCALLEEIELAKVEEIKQKTLKNLEKYQAAFNATNLNKYANAATGKYVQTMNATTSGKFGVNNPFARSGSKTGARSNAKSRGNVSVKES